MCTVQLRRVGKVYPDGHRAVRGVDLDIADGELFVLLGPSGCGKTSVLRMVAGLEDVTEGTVLFDGERVNDVPVRDRGLSMVFQVSALYPHMTVAENLGFPLRMARLDQDEIAPRVARAAGLLGLGDLLDRRPAQLSGGQRQRVALGRAIVAEPQLLLLDEPMSNIDAQLRVSLRAELCLLQRRLGLTTLHVTHDQVEAMTMGDRVAVMRAGLVVQEGSPADLYDRPVDVFVAQFVGSPPMNLFRGTIARLDDAPALALGRAVVLLGDRFRDVAAAHEVGREVVAGVRPSAFRAVGGGQLVMDVSSSERLGSHILVHGRLDAPGYRPRHAGAEAGADDDPLATDVPADPADRRGTVDVLLPNDHVVDPWQPLPLEIEPGGIHLFDADSGLALAA
jgi:multiple sugar transport system ATP-binding protein